MTLIIFCPGVKGDKGDQGEPGIGVNTGETLVSTRAESECLINNTFLNIEHK